MLYMRDQTILLSAPCQGTFWNHLYETLLFSPNEDGTFYIRYDQFSLTCVCIKMNVTQPCWLSDCWATVGIHRLKRPLLKVCFEKWNFVEIESGVGWLNTSVSSYKSNVMKVSCKRDLRSKSTICWRKKLMAAISNCSSYSPLTFTLNVF